MTSSAASAKRQSSSRDNVLPATSRRVRGLPARAGAGCRRFNRRLPGNWFLNSSAAGQGKKIRELMLLVCLLRYLEARLDQLCELLVLSFIRKRETNALLW